MRRRPSEHHETVSRRLALLSEQLASGRDEATREVSQVRPPLAPAAGDDWWHDHTRVTPARAPLVVVPQPARPPEPEPGPVAVAVPMPGRHAARRRVSVSGLVPDTLRGRLRVGPGQLAVVAVLVAVALAVTCWQVVRDDPEAPVPAPAPAADLVAVPASAAPGAGVPPTSAPGPAASSPSTSGRVTVDVAGKVRRAGIVVLDAGARVVDALEAAGGARPSVDLSTLNLARPLVDGEQILVGVAAPVPPGLPPPTPASPGAPVALVDLNLATQAELETLPDVGPVTAAAIMAWRDEHGGFTAVTELLEVDGIGDATLATLTPLVTV